MLRLRDEIWTAAYARHMNVARGLALAAVVAFTACHRDVAPQAQSAHDAVAILCGAEAAPVWPQGQADRSRAVRAWLDARISNSDTASWLDALFAMRPWDAGDAILARASHEHVAECHPLVALAGPRGLHGVDVPRLAAAGGTVASRRALIVGITASEIAIEGRAPLPTADLSRFGAELAAARPDQGAIMLVAEHGLTASALASLLDTARTATSVHEFRIVVTAPEDPRTVVIELPASRDAAQVQAIAAIHAGTDAVELNGTPVALDQLASAVAAVHPDVVLVTPDDDVTLQRLAEIVAAAGGRVAYGAASRPAGPVPPTPPR